jgi:hypothetical protein
MGGHEAPRRLGVNRGQVATENPSTSGSCWHRRHCSLQLVCHAQFVEPKEKGKAWGAKLRARCQHSDLAFICKETTAGGQQVKRAIPRSSRRTVKTEGRVSTQRHTDDVGYCLLWVSGRFRLAILGRRKRSLQDRSIFANVKRQIPSKLLNALSFIVRLQVASSML